MALRTVIFMGRIEAEVKRARPHWAVISISEWGAGPAQLEVGWYAILRQEFHDIDQEMPDEPYILFSEDQAREIIRFVETVEARGIDGILVHCKAGIDLTHV
ncbi:MAG: hypothetical protein KGK17_06565 [Betaproteobacteria bacterium]|nr:hypothetical protein [Betaproteobacteria bacterium]